MALAAAPVAAALGCGSEANDARPMCLANADTSGCMPLYPPEYPVIFRQVFSVTCAAEGVSCHGVMGAQGGLVLSDQAAAYAQLLGTDGGKARVVPGNAACSEMMVRLDLAGKAWSMPPGASLSADVRCSIRRWIAAGAPAMPTGTR
jgi:hypothetical protein